MVNRHQVRPARPKAERHDRCDRLRAISTLHDVCAAARPRESLIEVRARADAGRAKFSGPPELERGRRARAHAAGRMLEPMRRDRSARFKLVRDPWLTLTATRNLPTGRWGGSAG